MLSIASATPIYLVGGVTDGRKSYNGLVAIVRNELRADPLQGQVYVFCNNAESAIMWSQAAMFRSVCHQMSAAI
ncbi:MAG: IS66 family insertion sequence element accessory protein TnpB [Planctomycetota bacterium]